MKNKGQIILSIAVLLLFVFGCNLASQIKNEIEKGSEPKVLTSTDNNCQLTVPGSWKVETNLNAEATLQASKILDEQYVIVIRETRSDLDDSIDLDYFTNLSRENISQTMTSPVMSEPVAVNINGHSARQFEIAGTVNGINAKFLYAMIATDNNFYQVMTWTLAPRYEKNKDELQKVIDSFKEISGNDEPPPPVKSKDHSKK